MPRRFPRWPPNLARRQPFEDNPYTIKICAHFSFFSARLLVHQPVQRGEQVILKPRASNPRLEPGETACSGRPWPKNVPGGTFSARPPARQAVRVGAAPSGRPRLPSPAVLSRAYALSLREERSRHARSFVPRGRKSPKRPTLRVRLFVPAAVASRRVANGLGSRRL